MVRAGACCSARSRILVTLLMQALVLAATPLVAVYTTNGWAVLALGLLSGMLTAVGGRGKGGRGRRPRLFCFDSKSTCEKATECTIKPRSRGYLPTPTCLLNLSPG